MKIQLDIDKETSKKLGHYKIEHELSSKADAIKQILTKFFGGKK